MGPPASGSPPPCAPLETSAWFFSLGFLPQPPLGLPSQQQRAFSMSIILPCSEAVRALSMKSNLLIMEALCLASADFLLWSASQCSCQGSLSLL